MSQWSLSSVLTQDVRREETPGVEVHFNSHHQPPPLCLFFSDNQRKQNVLARWRQRESSKCLEEANADNDEPMDVAGNNRPSQTINADRNGTEMKGGISHGRTENNNSNNNSKPLSDWYGSTLIEIPEEHLLSTFQSSFHTDSPNQVNDMRLNHQPRMMATTASSSSLLTEEMMLWDEAIFQRVNEDSMGQSPVTLSSKQSMDENTVGQSTVTLANKQSVNENPEGQSTVTLSNTQSMNENPVGQSTVTGANKQSVNENPAGQTTVTLANSRGSPTSTKASFLWGESMNTSDGRVALSRRYVSIVVGGIVLTTRMSYIVTCMFPIYDCSSRTH